MTFLSWIKSSFEDDQGHASHRKLTVFFFCLLTLIMVILTFIRNNPGLFPEVVWMSVIAGALGMSYLRRKSVEDEIKSNIDKSITTSADSSGNDIVLLSQDSDKRGQS